MHFLLDRIALAALPPILLALSITACNSGTSEYSEENPSALRKYVTEPKQKAEDVKDKIEQQQRDADQQIKDLDTY